MLVITVLGLYLSARLWLRQIYAQLVLVFPRLPYFYPFSKTAFLRLSISACQTVLSVALSSSCIKSTDRQHIPSWLWMSGSQCPEPSPSESPNRTVIPCKRQATATASAPRIHYFQRSQNVDDTHRQLAVWILSVRAGIFQLLIRFTAHSP